MKTNLRKLISKLAILMLVSFGSAQAAEISGLFNTGVDDTNTLLGDNAVDTHYAIAPSWTAIAGNNPPPAFPGAWILNSDSLDSRWIAPESQPANVGDGGGSTVYMLTLSFDLTGFDPASASFSARLAADDSAQVFLNGGANLVGANTFNSWTTFSGNSGFNDGINTLAFHVTNTGFLTASQFPTNPTGLRVEFLESNVAAIPEPEIYAMLAAGLGLMGFVARRRKQQAVAV